MAVTSNAIPNVLSIVSSSLNYYAGKLYMSDNAGAKSLDPGFSRISRNRLGPSPATNWQMGMGRAARRALHSAVFLSHSKAAGHAENRRLCLFIPSVVAEREHRTQHQGGNTRCGSTNKSYAALIPAQAAFSGDGTASGNTRPPLPAAVVCRTAAEPLRRA